MTVDVAGMTERDDLDPRCRDAINRVSTHFYTHPLQCAFFLNEDVHLQAISQRGKRYSFDVVIIGSGIAGLIYALEFTKLKPTAKIALITKQALHDCNSNYAQGGIAAVGLEEDNFAAHIKDTLAAGDGLSKTAVVKKIIESGPKIIELLTEYGVAFDRVRSHYQLGREGGHSCRRVYHIKDRSGASIMSALIQHAKQNSRIKIFENHTAVNLIVQNPPHTPGSQTEVIGAYVLDGKGKIHTFLSKATVLATGGAGKVYRYTSNHSVATGDGVAMACRAGARVGNLEFYQFHPTLLFSEKNNNFLITEALRGEGALLINPITQQRFMQKYAPEKMELATRDIVARAIFNEIENSGCKFVYLDIRHQPKAFLKKRFPMIYFTLLKLGIDMSKDCIPVVPAAHYMCGGVLTDIEGHTDLKRLFAIGETAFTGFHGANRLASNSLLEGAVMGYQSAHASAQWIDTPVKFIKPVSDWSSKGVRDERRASQINALWRGLRGEMTSYAGIIRTQAGLDDLLKLILTRREMIEAHYWQYTITRDLVELRNIILVAELIVRSALHRHESRGGHYREDFKRKLRPAKETVFNLYGREPLMENEHCINKNK